MRSCWTKLSSLLRHGGPFFLNSRAFQSILSCLTGKWRRGGIILLGFFFLITLWVIIIIIIIFFLWCHALWDPSVLVSLVVCFGWRCCLSLSVYFSCTVKLLQLMIVIFQKIKKRKRRSCYVLYLLYSCILGSFLLGDSIWLSYVLSLERRVRQKIFRSHDYKMQSLVKSQDYWPPN